ncbi:VOC family protein [Haladaptatus sp. F3-133]|uniref:VOC family protein n=1 Tax=Halorutilus salinus TaxID=2487751 RepID=A0A9Q4C3I0_9EURY|nr:VOC family protein [Halorutilus salinus]MCX2818763.1 VOC family protein [Halorutilus salinus]
MTDDPTPLPTATNVHHIGVTVPDLDEAVGFFTDCLGARELYRKGPFGDDGDAMERRLGVHPDATASLAMLRLGPTANLELFEWDAPDADGETPRLSDTGATHIGIQVDDVDEATAAVEARDDATVLDQPRTNGSGPTAGMRYVFFRTPWGGYVELVEEPDGMPYTEESDDRLYGSAPSWSHRPDGE